VATLAIIGDTSIAVVEGDFNFTSAVSVCLDLVEVSGGLRRNITVNVTTEDGSATGGYTIGSCTGIDAGWVHQNVVGLLLVITS